MRWYRKYTELCFVRKTKTYRLGGKAQEGNCMSGISGAEGDCFCGLVGMKQGVA